jgi:hypothetical protein
MKNVRKKTKYNFKLVIKCKLAKYEPKKLEAIENKGEKKFRINFLYEIGF